MDNRVIPVFPLPVVQFPGELRPLHIFEPRYRKMLKDVMDGDRVFGIIYRGDEAILESEQLPSKRVGCTVEVAVAQGLPDGRSNILCVGGTRFRLLRQVEGELYLRAEVEFFEDDPTFNDLSPQAAFAKNLFQRVLAASRKLKDEGEREAGEMPDLPDEAPALSFIIAASLDIETNQKQELLELTDTSERLKRVTGILERLATDYERKAIVHQVAKTNGHGGKLPKFE